MTRKPVRISGFFSRADAEASAKFQAKFGGPTKTLRTATEMMDQAAALPDRTKNPKYPERLTSIRATVGSVYLPKRDEDRAKKVFDKIVARGLKRAGKNE